MMDFDVTCIAHFRPAKRFEFLMPVASRVNPARTIDFSAVEKSSAEELHVFIEKLLGNPCFKHCLPKMHLVQDYFRAKNISTATDRRAHPSLSLRMDPPDWTSTIVEAFLVFTCLKLEASLSLTTLKDIHTAWRASSRIARRTRAARCCSEVQAE